MRLRLRLPLAAAAIVGYIVYALDMEAEVGAESSWATLQPISAINSRL